MIYTYTYIAKHVLFGFTWHTWRSYYDPTIDDREFIAMAVCKPQDTKQDVKLFSYKI